MNTLDTSSGGACPELFATNRQNYPYTSAHNYPAALSLQLEFRFLLNKIDKLAWFYILLAIKDP
jgi:hypothetical protein